MRSEPECEVTPVGLEFDPATPRLPGYTACSGGGFVAAIGGSCARCLTRSLGPGPGLSLQFCSKFTCMYRNQLVYAGCSMMAHPLLLLLHVLQLNLESTPGRGWGRSHCRMRYWPRGKGRGCGRVLFLSRSTRRSTRSSFNFN